MDHAILSRRTLLQAGLVAAGSIAAPVGAHAGALPLAYGERGTLTIEAVVAGAVRRPFLWDTGSAKSVLSEPFAQSLGLPLEPGGTVAGTGGLATTRTVTAGIDIAGVGRYRIPFLVAPFSGEFGEVAGLLGTDILARAPFSIDYASGLLHWRAPAPATRVPLTMHGFVPTTEVQVNGARLRLHLDTGAASAPGADHIVHLTSREAEIVGLTGEPEEFVTAAGTGGLTIPMPVFRLESFMIAGRALAPAKAIVRAPVGYYAAPDALGFIGNAVFDKLTPHFDYAGGVFGIGV